MVDEQGDIGNNAPRMRTLRFTYALYYRYWFTGSGGGEARVREVRMQS
jgi:hypothetical protein